VSSNASQPDEPLVFIIDRSLGRHKVASALREAGAVVEVHDELFDPAADDIVWLSHCGQHGWIAITKDLALARRRTQRSPGEGGLERLTIHRAGARVFMLKSKRGLTGEEMANALVAALDRMRRFCASHQAPFIAKVYRNGSVQLYEDFE
jgi:hypothetical protein